MEYNNYLMSNKWNKIRYSVYERDHFCCKYCGKKFSINKLNAHHLTYKHVYHEEDHLEDLVTLCLSCHRLIHRDSQENIKFLQKIGHKVRKL